MANSPPIPDVAAALAPTYFLDCDYPAVRAFARDRTAGAATPVERAVALFYAVRDEVEYKLLTRLMLRREEFVASATLRRRNGFCIEKAVLLAAACRAAGIPARLRFADVRNHLTTPELAEFMGTDVFICHGLVEMLLADRWVKATPAFDRAMCVRHGVRPIEFDGSTDAIFHEFDVHENRHMEYVNDRGVHDDLPYDEIVAAFRATYPQMYG
jgi:transglutaminase-like putative cysteine protease